jgi:hypothetical protein
MSRDVPAGEAMPGERGNRTSKGLIERASVTLGAEQRAQDSPKAAKANILARIPIMIHPIMIHKGPWADCPRHASHQRCDAIVNENGWTSKGHVVEHLSALKSRGGNHR